MREIGTIAGLRVLTIDEAANLGSVSQVVVDLALGQVLGVILSAGGGERAIAAAEIQTIGADVVMVSSREVAVPVAEATEIARFRRPANAAPLQVFTTSGRRLGAVSAIFIDPLEKVVTRYEVSGGPLKDMAEGILILPVIAGSVHGQDAVIIPDESVEEVGRETGGLFAKLSSLGQKVKGVSQQAAEKVEKAVEQGTEVLKKEAEVVKVKTGELTVKAKGQVQQAGAKIEAVAGKGAEVLKQEAAELKEKATETVEQGAEVLKKEAAAVKAKAAGAKQKAAEMAEEAKEALTDMVSGEEGKAAEVEGATPAPAEASAEEPATEATPETAGDPAPEK